ncbi:MAG TPA: helix-turn-helix domain-containing protein [Hyphomicrobiaceae bacterium]
MARTKKPMEPASGAAAAKPKRRGGQRKKQDRAKAEIERQERIAEALEYRRQGFTYRQIADTMGVSTTTAFAWVQQGLEAITLESALAVKKLVLDRYDDILQRLMPMLEDGADRDVVDQIVKIQDKILALHGLTGNVSLSFDGGDDGEGDEAIVIARIKASVPVLRPDTPVPPNPIL